MAAAAVNSLLANFPDDARSRGVAANDRSALVDFAALNVGGVEATAVLALIYLDTGLGLGLVLALVENVF